ncbi:MAG: 5'-deoxynucleotidase [Clostridiales bacterium]|nr:5'-deoxynucleotidase [Clostridiales bacterium]
MEHHFFAYISRMKFIQRWGLMRNTIPENDMEHALQTAMFAHAIAVIGVERYHRAYNPEHIMALALYHDGAEVITGDLPTPIKHHNPAIKLEYNKLEEIAADKLLSMLPNDLRPAYAPLIRHDETTDEWAIVKAADKICAYIKCLEERKAGNLEFEQARKATKKSIDRLGLPEVQDFMSEFVPGFSMTLDEISEEA